MACSSAKAEVHEVQRPGIVAYISALSQVWVCERKKERERESERECVCVCVRVCVLVKLVRLLDRWKLAIQKVIYL